MDWGHISPFILRTDRKNVMLLFVDFSEAGVESPCCFVFVGLLFVIPSVVFSCCSARVLLWLWPDRDGPCPRLVAVLTRLMVTLRCFPGLVRAMDGKKGSGSQG